MGSFFASRPALNIAEPFRTFPNIASSGALDRWRVYLFGRAARCCARRCSARGSNREITRSIAKKDLGRGDFASRRAAQVDVHRSPPRLP
jgi:hypothetical protein